MEKSILWIYRFKIGWKVVEIQMLGLKYEQNDCFKDLNLQQLFYKQERWNGDEHELHGDSKST